MCSCGAGSSIAISTRFTIVVALSGIIAAQTGQAPTQPAAPVSQTAISGPTPAALQPRHPRYRVMPSDVLAVSFPISPELNFTPTVQPDGFISIANVGSVYVEGQTVTEIVETLKAAYAKVLHDPIIAVDVTNFQPPQFTVLGQVGKPGQYPLRVETTVSQAIAVGGGFLPTAKGQVFVFHRVSSEWVSVTKFHAKKVLRQGKKLQEDALLRPGDMVFVPETFISHFRQFVPYATGVSLNPSGVLF